MDIIAHRGASGTAPENTLPAFRLAWELAADGIELDVRLSADGVVMVHHDASTQRCSGVDLTVEETDCRRLQQLDVGAWRGPQYAGVTIPTLQDVLAEVPTGKRVLIEIKSGLTIVPALQQVLKQHIPQQPTDLGLISFHLEVLESCRMALPEVPCYPIFSTQDPDNRADKHSIPAWMDYVQQHGFAGLDPDCQDITAEFAAAMRAADLELLTWTVNDPVQAATLAEYGVAAITTDWPGRIRDALAANLPKRC